MATYCVGDIHGMYDKYRELLRRLELKPDDTLYVLGDMVDRGPNPMKVVLDLMERPNAVALAGNHDLLACIFLKKLIHGGRAEDLTEDSMADILSWSADGGSTTLKEFRELPIPQRQAVVEWLGELPVYEEVEAGGKSFVLVHAGFGESFSPERPLDSYDFTDYLMARPDYGKVYFPDRYLVTGHTPTRLIHGKDTIYRANNHIAIDCGACFGGRLAAVCLETGEEFYV